MHQWYFSYNGAQSGPLDHAAAVTQAQRDSNGYCWRAGFAEWVPIAHVAELRQSEGTAMAAPPPPRAGMRADEIDYTIYGEDMQFVEIELDPGESCVAEAGTLMYKDVAIKMETVFGDGSQQASGGGFFDKLVGAGKRLITGESLFTTVFTHGGSGKGRAAFAAPYPGTIIPMTLSNFGGMIVCQKDSFLAAAKGVQIGIFFQKKILTGLFGGEGFIMQKLEGDGLVFVHAGDAEFSNIGPQAPSRQSRIHLSNAYRAHTHGACATCSAEQRRRIAARHVRQRGISLRRA